MRTCIDCGADISDRHGNARRCGECHQRYEVERKRLIKKNTKCLRCGAELDLNQRKFCSTECQIKFRRENAKHGKKYKTCPACGKTFDAKRKSQSFCSAECRSIAVRVKEYYQRKGELHKTKVDRDYGIFPGMPEKLAKKLYEEYWVQGADGLLELIEIGKKIKFE